MKKGKVWYDGKLRDSEDINVPLLSFGLQYGWGVFEGIRAYETPRGFAVFRLRDHVKRLYRSAKILGLDVSYSFDELRNAVLDTVAANDGADYIRPFVFGGEGSSVSLGNNDFDTHVAIAAVKMGEYVPGAEEKGLQVVTSPWEKPRWRCFPVTAKTCGAYVNLVLAKRNALHCGADEALMLNSSGTIAEGSAENVFLVEGDMLSTPPLSAGILGGITRDTVMRLAADSGYSIAEREISWDETVSADEVFMCGTALEIQAVVSLDGRIIGNGKVGKVTRQMMNTYHDAARGRIPKYAAWCESPRMQHFASI